MRTRVRRTRAVARGGGVSLVWSISETRSGSCVEVSREVVCSCVLPAAVLLLLRHRATPRRRRRSSPAFIAAPPPQL